MPGAMPPTGSSNVPAGSTASSALTTAGEASSAGNSLSPCAPAASAANASVGVMMPGRQADQTQAHGLTNNITIKVGRDNQLAAYGMHLTHLCWRQHSASTDQRARMLVHQQVDADQRVGRVERDLQ